jgi:hypothetical protein
MPATSAGMTWRGYLITSERDPIWNIPMNDLFAPIPTTKSERRFRWGEPTTRFKLWIASHHPIQPSWPAIVPAIHTLPGTQACTALAAGHGERWNSLFQTNHSLFGQKKFPVSARAGNWLQAVGPAWRPAPKAAPRGWNRAKFPKIPCYFPCSQGIRTPLIGFDIRKRRD